MKHIDFEYCLPFDNDNPELWMRIEHLGRYVFAADYIERIGAKTVLDVACANGYGSLVMAETDAHIIGIDYNQNLINTAITSADAAHITNAQFRCADLNTDPLNDIGAHLITCFDTLEHLASPSSFLAKLSALQNSGAALLLSVPKAKYEPVDSGGIPTNTFHLHRFDKDELTALLADADYRIEKTLGQPYTNINMSLMSNAVRDSQTTKQQAVSYFDHSDEALLFLARMFGLPSADLYKFSYSTFIIAKKV